MTFSVRCLPVVFRADPGAGHRDRHALHDVGLVPDDLLARDQRIAEQREAEIVEIEQGDVLELHAVGHQVEDRRVVEGDHRVDVTLEKQRVAQLHVDGDAIEGLRIDVVEIEQRWEKHRNGVGRACAELLAFQILERLDRASREAEHDSRKHVENRHDDAWCGVRIASGEFDNRRGVRQAEIIGARSDARDRFAGSGRPVWCDVEAELLVDAVFDGIEGRGVAAVDAELEGELVFVERLRASEIWHRDGCARSAATVFSALRRVGPVESEVMSRSCVCVFSDWSE